MIFSRRHFLQNAAAAAAFPSFPVFGQQGSRVFRTALIGSGWWGMNILREAMAAKRSKVVALCDVDAGRLKLAAAEVTALNGDQPKTYADFRALLDKERPEIVIIATPDHWHALPALAAMQAGSHVYVEKPTAHTVNESRAMVHCAKATGVTTQVGLHRRVGPHHVSAMNFLREGRLGKVGSVRLFVHSRGGRESPRPNSPPPEDLDWDFYCGPAPLRPFNSRIHPGGWREFLDFANGQIGDWGVHWLDQVLWWSGETAPRRVFSTGSRPLSGPAVLTKEDQTTDSPEQQQAIFEFQNFTATWEHRKFAGSGAEKHSLGACFYGTAGTLHIGWRDGWTFYPANDKAASIHQDAQLQEPDGHNISLLWADFLDAIDRKRPATCSLETAHRSSTLPMLAMISMRTGRSLQWDGAKEEIVGDPEASGLLQRKYRGPWSYPQC
ncbi:MAG: Gfo/Idh/MocA family oxidoreductase [Verrucomicrobiales bacterium]|nr:Gfo/Idh/MocA family oxidoreductase [Verrucomicrobiales bacterium]